MKRIIVDNEKWFHAKWDENENKDRGKQADLSKAILNGANLRGAYLRAAELQETKLTNANLQMANLGAANMQRTALGGASLKGAYLYRADLQDAALWFARMQPREYRLHASGWVRFVSGLQLLISVYLLALCVLSYFGRPFEGY